MRTDQTSFRGPFPGTLHHDRAARGPAGGPNPAGSSAPSRDALIDFTGDSPRENGLPHDAADLASSRSLGNAAAVMPTILVVDDDRDSRELLTTLLSCQGYQTVEAGNGREALACLDRLPRLCLILLDLMMPVMDGWDFRAAQQQHDRHGHVPVVIVTADIRMEGRGRDLEAAALLTKPLDLDAVLQQVQQHCGPGLAEA